MDVLYDYMFWLHMKIYIVRGCEISIAYGEMASRLGSYVLRRSLVIPNEHRSYTCVNFVLGLTRSKNRRKLIFVMSNEIFFYHCMIVS